MVKQAASFLSDEPSRRVLTKLKGMHESLQTKMPFKFYQITIIETGMSSKNHQFPHDNSRYKTCEVYFEYVFQV